MSAFQASASLIEIKIWQGKIFALTLKKETLAGGGKENPAGR